VPAELAEVIFEPYRRAHSLGTATEAVGLGLTVSRSLAEAMGGSLDYVREGEWCVFELRLPLFKEDATAV
jgi:signal transduction histidine kinase